ncbi:hypothetical protein PRZ48_009779 [Zasmidium cellare]|uniref:ACB domain-containing protein n=1 Tax=Zasmidium cellare TaxID=395010 RepID=A0ABR0EDD1_ZASCE|nr:hypothetical protein PRZ48_009779 [Zasmidium cellare]
MPESTEFKKAADEVQNLKTKPNQDQLLELYALFKIGKEEEVKKPGLIDIQGKYKYQAWEKETKAGTTPEQAQKKYVELVEKLKKEIGTKSMWTEKLVLYPLDAEHLINACVFRSDAIVIGSIREVFEKSKACSLCFLFARALDQQYGDSLSSEYLDQMKCSAFARPTWKFYIDEREVHSGRIDGKTTEPGTFRAAPDIAEHEHGSFIIELHPFLLTGERLRPCIVSPVVDPRASRSNNQLCQRLLQPAGIDFDLVRKWYRLCRTVHAERCSEPQWVQVVQYESLRVVDVEKRSVQLAPPSCSFAALSYVWGSSESQVVLTVEEHKRLVEGPFELTKLPNVVEDAIQVTKELGLRYLWVDALCIPQRPVDNPEKARQLHQMNGIFRSAEVCIIAAGCKDVNDHIPGVHTSRAASTWRLVNGRALAVSEPKYEDEIPSTTWNRRGWTYQERTLARRALALGPTQAYWTCQCEEWCESVTLEPAEPGIEAFPWRKLPDTSRPPDHLVQLSVYDFLDSHVESDSNAFMAYQRVVEDFTMRRIGRADDGLNAVAGILGVLQRYFMDEWLTLRFGLPQGLFDMALLWIPKSLCQRSQMWTSQNNRLPSWSWTSWMSNVGDGMGYSYMLPGLSSPGRIPIMPALQWYVLDEPSKKPIPMPIPDQSSPLWHCKHRGVPCGADPSRLSEKPPVFASLPPRPKGYYLQCLTTTLTLHLGPPLDMDTTEERFAARKPYELTDAEGHYAGTIVLADDELEESPSMEFVFLSYDQNMGLCGVLPGLQRGDLGTLPKRLVEWAIPQRPKGEFEVVNALWVGRCEGGYCERRLVGSVLVEAWEEMGPRTEWIVLG